MFIWGFKTCYQKSNWKNSILNCNLFQVPAAQVAAVRTAAGGAPPAGRPGTPMPPPTTHRTQPLLTKWWLYIAFNLYFFNFTLYPVNSKVGRGNLILKHAIPHFLIFKSDYQTFKVIACVTLVLFYVTTLLFLLFVFNTSIAHTRIYPKM